MKTKINGVTWKIEIVTPKQMKKQRDDGEHLAGLCVYDEKTIYIAEDCVTFQTVAHELYHAYWANLYLDDTNEVKITDVEEIAAAHFADKAIEIIKQAHRVTRRLQKGQK